MQKKNAEREMRHSIPEYIYSIPIYSPAVLMLIRRAALWLPRYTRYGVQYEIYTVWYGEERIATLLNS